MEPFSLAIVLVYQAVMASMNYHIHSYLIQSFNMKKCRSFWHSPCKRRIVLTIPRSPDGAQVEVCLGRLPGGPGQERPLFG